MSHQSTGLVWFALLVNLHRPVLRLCTAVYNLLVDHIDTSTKLYFKMIIFLAKSLSCRAWITIQLMIILAKVLPPLQVTNPKFGKAY